MAGEDRCLRILVAGISWPPETFLQRLIEGLGERAVEITVASSTKPERSWLLHPLRGWLWTPSWNVPHFARIYNTIRLVFKWIRSSAQGKNWLRLSLNGHQSWRQYYQRAYLLIPYLDVPWDVIYFPWNSAAVAGLPLFDRGVPIVISCRGSQISVASHNPTRSDFQKGLRKTFEYAAAVHCVSRAIQEDAVPFGLISEKARVIRPAVDPDFFVPVSERAMHLPLVILMTGALTWRKGYEYALLTMRHLLDAGVEVELQIVGDGPDRQRIQYTIQDLGLNEHVRLLGKLSPDQVHRSLQHADLFLLSSLSEGISNAVLEAMSCGIPVVTTDCGGMTEALTDGVEGFVVPVRDPQAAAAALKRLCDDPDLRIRMGLAARKRILDQFDLRNQVDAFLELFQKASGKTQ